MENFNREIAQLFRATSNPDLSVRWFFRRQTDLSVSILSLNWFPYSYKFEEKIISSILFLLPVCRDRNCWRCGRHLLCCRTSWSLSAGTLWLQFRSHSDRSHAGRARKRCSIRRGGFLPDCYRRNVWWSFRRRAVSAHRVWELLRWFWPEFRLNFLPPCSILM